MAETTDAVRRAQLTEEHRHLMAQLSHIGRAPRDVVSGDPADREGGELEFDEGFADSGQVTAERGEVDALATSLLEGLHEVDDALAKFEAGTYGNCENCGSQIGESRLEAMPSARFCIACASARR
ncbi:MAG: TraR/DksA family transcriptional regulator [Acidimicrobiia bacterium]